MVSGIIDMVRCCFAVGALTVRIQYLTDHMKRNKKVMGSSPYTHIHCTLTHTELSTLTHTEQQCPH